VALTHIEKDPLDRDVNTEAQAEAAALETGALPGPGGRGGRGAAAGAPANVQVKIEWDELERRITQLTRVAGSVSTVVPAPDSRTYLFMAMAGGAGGGEEPVAAGGPAMYTISEDGTRLTRLNTTVADAAGAAVAVGAAAAALALAGHGTAMDQRRPERLLSARRRHLFAGHPGGAGRR